MKKHLMVTTATGAVLAMTVPVQADTYISLFGGLSKLDNQSATIHTNSGSFLSGTSSAYVSGNGGYWNFQGTSGFTSLISDFWLTKWKYTKTWVTRNSSDVVNYNTTISADYDFDTGFVIGAAFGWELTNLPVSVELEFAYRKHDGQADVFYNYSWTAAGYFSSSWNIFYFNSWNEYHRIGPYTKTWLTGGVTNVGGFGIPLSSGAFTSAGGSSFTNSHSGDIRSWAIMANAWYDFNPGGTWHPYVGGGVGYADVEFEAGPVSASDSGLAFQFAVGIGFDINPTTRLSGEYRYFSVPDIELMYMGEDLGLEYDLNEFIVGFKFDF